MAKAPNYPELVEQAEKSVQGVNDPELKRIAFGKVLEELLGGRSSTDRLSRKKADADRSSKTTKAFRSGPMNYIREMIEDGFFKTPKAVTDVKVELENRGHHIPLTALGGLLQRLCEEKQLRRRRHDGRFDYSNRR